MKSRQLKTCLIGGSGFIGSALTPILIESGREVLIIDQTAPAVAPPSVIFRQGDYGDRQFMQSALHNVDEIVLLAYASVPKTSFEDPLADITNNLPPALNLFEVARTMQLQKMIILSSGGTVYGQSLVTPIKESHPTNPVSPYGITKLAIEKYAGMYHQLYGLATVILRPSNAYGEGQRPFTGQGFIATAIASVMANKDILQFGRDGSVRDYIHVDDIATAILASLDDGRVGGIYNVGTGVGTSNRQVMSIIQGLAAPRQLQAQVKIAPQRSFDVPTNILNCALLTKETGWKPTVVLQDGLQRTWEWFRQHETS